MRKNVEMGPTAYRWFRPSKRIFISEAVIISVVLYTPESEREYIDESHFKIRFRRKKDSEYVEIIIWVEEKLSTYFIYKIHSCRL
jgi:hypothetical protein